MNTLYSYPNINQTIPQFLYGTAWKEKATQNLTTLALESGFRGIDTANQRKHYFEEVVGLGIEQFLSRNSCQREDLFLQSKFTHANGQDHRKPYNENDSFTNQVQQSFASSLQHLKTTYLDSYVLHCPLYNNGLAEADWEVWAAMEALVTGGQVRLLGVSNVNLSQLQELYKQSTIKPSFVQNRCFAVTLWDQEIRNFCSEHKIIYQGFSLLTANQTYIFSPPVQNIAKKYQKTIPQIIFAFAKNIGILPLTGTSDREHMLEDLAVSDLKLELEELRKIELLGRE